MVRSLESYERRQICSSCNFSTSLHQTNFPQPHFNRNQPILQQHNPVVELIENYYHVWQLVCHLLLSTLQPLPTLVLFTMSDPSVEHPSPLLRIYATSTMINPFLSFHLLPVRISPRTPTLSQLQRTTVPRRLLLSCDMNSLVVVTYRLSITLSKQEGFNTFTLKNHPTDWKDVCKYSHDDPKLGASTFQVH
jgi:hypothetical protein